jgi:hypothetical protein
MFYDPAAAFLVGFSNLDRICSARVVSMLLLDQL